MPRNCSVCRHPQRAEIDRALVAGAANTHVSSLFVVSEPAIRRHKAGHLPATLTKAAGAEEAARADDLLDQLRALQARTLALLGKAETAGKLGTAVMAIGEARRNLELLARLLGELDERPVNLLVLPEWLSVRTVLIEALAPYPEARQAVAVRLMEIEAGNGHRG